MNYQQILYSNYQQCRQGDHSIADYTEEFHRLGTRNNLPENEQQQIARFVFGLRENIKRVVNLHSIAYLVDVIALASKVEEEEASPKKSFSKKNHLGKSAKCVQEEQS